MPKARRAFISLRSLARFSFLLPSFIAGGDKKDAEKGYPWIVARLREIRMTREEPRERQKINRVRGGPRYESEKGICTVSKGRGERATPPSTIEYQRSRRLKSDRDCFPLDIYNRSNSLIKTYPSCRRSGRTGFWVSACAF